MIAEYKGFEIEVIREEGSSLIHISIIRISDRYLLDDNLIDSNDTIKDHIEYMKGRIDRYIKTGEE